MIEFLDNSNFNQDDVEINERAIYVLSFQVQ